MKRRLLAIALVCVFAVSAAAEGGGPEVPPAPLPPPASVPAPDDSGTSSAAFTDVLLALLIDTLT